MNNLSMYGVAFLISTVKFLFAASIARTSSLSPFEIAISTGLGALCSFNVFYFSARYFMKKAKAKKQNTVAEGITKEKPIFTWINKFMVRTKRSKSGFWIICIFAPLILSIPVGSIIVAKFYRELKITYPVATISLGLWAFILAYLNDFIFSFFE